MAVRVVLDAFEGPLDLLLYVIKREEIDIYDIPIARVTEQYLEYIRLMRMLDLEVAGEFLVMAATLMHIKSQMLLPRPTVEDDEEAADPRAELVERLLEYERCKRMAVALGEKEAARALLFERGPAAEDTDKGGVEIELSNATAFDLLSAFARVLSGLSERQVVQIVEEVFTVSEKVRLILDLIRVHEVVNFTELFYSARSRAEAIVTFLALLELVRLREVVARQGERFGEVRIYAA